MTSRLLAYAQLLRLPNVFTAFADIFMAGCAAGVILERPGAFTFVLIASGCLYVSGMVFNDFFDRHDDARSQPFRPIPSGRVSALTALILGCVLMLIGGSFAAATMTFGGVPLSFFSPPGIAGLLIVAILSYNAFLKQTPAGPIGMGLCRFLNVLLGLSAADPGTQNVDLSVHLASVIGLYIVGVTWFARTEEGTSQKSHLSAAFGVMIAALLLTLTVPIHLSEGTVTPLYPYLLVAFGFWIGLAAVKAIRHPTPKPVQMAVKRCILGLVLLDAILATAFVGPAGLLIGLLLLPANWLGKWVYST